jgi:hypothetical protein
MLNNGRCLTSTVSHADLPPFEWPFVLYLALNNIPFVLYAGKGLVPRESPNFRAIHSCNCPEGHCPPIRGWSWDRAFPMLYTLTIIEIDNAICSYSALCDQNHTESLCWCKLLAATIPCEIAPNESLSIECEHLGLPRWFQSVFVSLIYIFQDPTVTRKTEQKWLKRKRHGVRAQI